MAMIICLYWNFLKNGQPLVNVKGRIQKNCKIVQKKTNPDLCGLMAASGQ